jgi:hypothetical protein
MRQISHEEIAVTMQLKGFPVHSHKEPWMLNIIGIRSNDQTPETFDDAIIFFRYDGLKWDWMQCDGTTDPGLYYLKNPLRSDGTIIMMPGHYPNLYKRGHHKSEEAFRQIGSAMYIRDNNKDGYLDLALMNVPGKPFVADNVYTNLHDAHEQYKLEKIGKYSAGCQVVADSDEFDIALSWGNDQVKHCGVNKFNYTLLLESELQTL